jgi:LPXTG-motif cell wall-anchored protein
MALQALGGHATEVADAADWLTGQRNAAGYWISQGVPNTNSTGLAAAALAGAGLDVAASRGWLLDQRIDAGQPGAGALKYAGDFDPTTTSATSPSVLATAQGVLGLADGGSLATVTAAGSADAVDLLAPVVSLSPEHQTIGSTATAHGVAFAAGERVTATVAGDTLGDGTADPGGAVDVTFDVPDPALTSYAIVLSGAASGLTATARLDINGAPGGAPSSGGPGTGGTGGGGGDSGPPLADTGTNSTDLTGVGLAALLAGAGVLALARQRRRGRHAG